ncbi:MAG: FAD-dependent monooxygenase [Chloroflexota bacterium]|nr:FAD-dependent monooxygenase [Chloroflexota bacterium]
MTSADGPGREQSSPTRTVTAVLIAGGGPGGLTTAIELSFHGVACLVVEFRPAGLAR